MGNVVCVFKTMSGDCTRVGAVFSQDLRGVVYIYKHSTRQQNERTGMRVKSVFTKTEGRVILHETEE